MAKSEKIAVCLADDRLQSLLEEGLSPFYDLADGPADVGVVLVVTDQKNASSGNDNVLPHVYIGDDADTVNTNVFTLPLRLSALVSFIRRTIRTPVTAGLVPAQDETIKIGPFALALHSGEMWLDNGSGDKTRLTEKERDILAFLYRHKGKTIERAALLDTIWGYVEGIETHTLETHIYRLRQKIERDPSNPTLLITEGTGYCLMDEE